MEKCRKYGDKMLLSYAGMLLAASDGDGKAGDMKQLFNN